VPLLQQKEVRPTRKGLLILQSIKLLAYLMDLIARNGTGSFMIDQKSKEISPS
jgi:hypothetical protein